MQRLFQGHMYPVIRKGLKNRLDQDKLTMPADQACEVSFERFEVRAWVLTVLMCIGCVYVCVHARVHVPWQSACNSVTWHVRKADLEGFKPPLPWGLNW